MSASVHKPEMGLLTKDVISTHVTLDVGRDVPEKRQHRNNRVPGQLPPLKFGDLIVDRQEEVEALDEPLRRLPAFLLLLAELKHLLV